MTILSAQKLENYLKEYELHLKYWLPDDGDGNELLGCREILAQNYTQLSDSDKAHLTRLDGTAEKLLSSYKGKLESFDMVMLKKCVSIAKQLKSKND